MYRTVTEKRQPINPPKVANNGHFEPMSDVVGYQRPRKPGKFEGSKHFSRHNCFLMNPDSDQHHIQAVSEWKAISKAKGYHGSFPNWILEHNVEWYPCLPTIDYVQQILQ